MSRVIHFTVKPYKSSDGTQFWWINGNLHREDGPAVEYTNGSKHWYLNGLELTELEHFWQSLYFKTLPDKERLMMLLSMGD